MTSARLVTASAALFALVRHMATPTASTAAAFVGALVAFVAWEVVAYRARCAEVASFADALAVTTASVQAVQAEARAAHETAQQALHLAQHVKTGNLFGGR